MSELVTAGSSASISAATQSPEESTIRTLSSSLEVTAGSWLAGAALVQPPFTTVRTSPLSSIVTLGSSWIAPTLAIAALICCNVFIALSPYGFDQDGT